jgi:hypothetical protein
MSQLEVDKVIPQSGTTLTLGESGDTITIASGATFTPTLTAPIIDEINDNNGNEEIIFTTTTSAVNELTIANAATGNAPEIAATGDDTDIDLKLTPKGAGNLVLDGIEFPNADGSANQVLQTNGSGVLSFATPVAGITEADQWRLTASLNFSGSITPITANLERSDTAGFNYIGTGMTESSGVFTFPSTGIWMIMIQAMVTGNGATANYASVHFQTTQNNSTYVSQVNQIVSGIESTGSYANGFGVSFFDVTDISTHKCKFAQDAENTTCQLYGNTTIQSTGFTFIRLGDT